VIGKRRGRKRLEKKEGLPIQPVHTVALLAWQVVPGGARCQVVPGARWCRWCVAPAEMTAYPFVSAMRFDNEIFVNLT